MEILSVTNPVLIIRFYDESEPLKLNMGEFLKSMIKDSGNPYFSILKPENFGKVYTLEDRLIWPEVIEATVCSGEMNKHDAVFTEKEILQYLESVSKQ